MLEPAATAAAMARIVDVNRRAYERAIERAGPRQFVEAITLRPADAARLKPQLDGIRGALAVEDRAPLAPTRDFARALLGTVAPANAEQLKKLGERYAPGDSVGQWGLQAAFERRLAGTPDRRVVIRVGGSPTRTLRRRRGRPGSDVRTTLDIATQRAAEAALGDSQKAEPRWSPCSRRPATSSPSRTAPATRRSTARSRAAIHRARRSR